MATDINEVYKMFPCAKEVAEENINYWDSEEPLHSSILDASFCEWMSDTVIEDELQELFRQIENYDWLLFENNYITEDEILKNRNKIQELSLKYLKQPYFKNFLKKEEQND